MSKGLYPPPSVHVQTLNAVLSSMFSTIESTHAIIEWEWQWFWNLKWRSSWFTIANHRRPFSTHEMDFIANFWTQLKWCSSKLDKEFTSLARRQRPLLCFTKIGDSETIWTNIPKNLLPLCQNDCPSSNVYWFCWCKFFAKQYGVPKNFYNNKF